MVVTRTEWSTCFGIPERNGKPSMRSLTHLDQSMQSMGRISCRTFGKTSLTATLLHSHDVKGTIMMQAKQFVWLDPATMDAPSLTKSAYEEARKTWLCTGCCHPRPGVEAVDVQIDAPECLEDVVLTFVAGCSVGLAHRDFLTALPAAAVSDDLWLGNVYDPSGNPIDDWKTYRARHKLFVRGTKHVGYRECDECGRHLYFAMGRRYLFPSPPEGICLFEGYCSLILPETCFEQLPVKTWPAVYVQRLPVVSKPKDGLGVLA